MLFLSLLKFYLKMQQFFQEKEAEAPSCLDGKFVPL